MTDYEIRRGATARFLLKDASGGDIDGWTCSASLRALMPAQIKLNGGEPVAAEFTVSPYSDEAGVGWYLDLPAAVTDDLTPGAYLADARIALPGGEIVITEGWVIRVSEPATIA